MGRLFWKFFFAFLGALLTAGIGVGFAVSLLHEQPEVFARRLEPPPPPPPMGEAPPAFSRPPADAPPMPLPRRGPPPPVLPIVAGLLASLAASALLAWYFAGPSAPWPTASWTPGLNL